MKKKKNILVVSFQSLTEHSAGGMARLGYYLSQELYKRNLLDKFIVYSKGKYEPDFSCEPVSKWARHYLFAINKLNQHLKLPAHQFRLIQEQQFDRFCVQHIHKGVDILLTTNAHMRRTFKKAKKLGISIIYIPANQEENIIYGLVKEEQKRLNLQNIDAYTYQPRLKFYNQSIKYVDTVIGTYPTVYNSYKKVQNSNYDVVQITGHLKPDFKPYTMEERPQKEVLHVGYLAHTVILKGLQYLLEAWELLLQEQPQLKIKLSIAGYIEPKLKAYIEDKFRDLKQVDILGRVDDVPEYFKSLDIFVVPSLAEGGPYTALEAALYGVPVLITDNCGSAELLERNERGCITVPIQNAERIKQELYNAYQNRNTLPLMGMNAKRNLDTYNMHELFTKLANYLEQR